uniref:Uncharacterized protein n=1 Tax=Rhizophora mucronata TaxID=61149 RepID=A0A2P2PHL1_RHIMU
MHILLLCCLNNGYSDLVDKFLYYYFF